jgi:hypothetical protein
MGRQGRRSAAAGVELVDGVRMPVGIPRRPIRSLRETRGNPRLHAPAQLDALAQSIQQFGFLAPIVVDRRGSILAGHARLAAARQLGLRELPVVIETWLTPAQRQAYLIADNQLTVAGSWDDEALTTLLAELQAHAELLPALGFPPEQLAELLATAAAGAAAEAGAAPGPAFPSYDDATMETSYQCPSCGFEADRGFKRANCPQPLPGYRHRVPGAGGAVRQLPPPGDHHGGGGPVVHRRAPHAAAHRGHPQSVLADRPGHARWVSLPAVGDEFLRQLTAEQLVRRVVKGYERQEWIKVYNRNEALDCRVYARAAAHLVGLDRFGEDDWRRLEAPFGTPPPAPVAAPPGGPPVVAPPGAPPAGVTWRRSGFWGAGRR